MYGTCLNQVRATQSLVLAALAGSILATNVPPCDLIHTTFRKRTDLRAGALPGLLREAGHGEASLFVAGERTLSRGGSSPGALALERIYELTQSVPHN